ncbi:MAG: ABC transporter ATP-binding protein, partial [Candidatus Hodarchaeota archaeon]
MNHDTVIQTNDLTKIFHLGESKIYALNRVTLSVIKGRIISIMGVSGCGKSTLLHLIGGIDNPTSGTIYSCGKILTQLSESELADYRRRDVGFIFQFGNLSPILTAEENIQLPLKILELPREEQKKRVKELLSWVSMENRSNHPPHALSGGERQRIAVAIALANNPSLILADEPTGELDTKNTEI